MKTIYDQYTHEELEQIISISTSWKDFARKLGYSNSPSGDTIKMLQRKAANFDTSHFTPYQERIVIRSAENVFVENSTVSQKVLRSWYKKGEYTPYICSICGQKPIWQGKELTLILDHISGINNDDRLENLRWVCPNCNQQLETTGARNPNRSKFAKKYYCQDCGKEICRGAIRCLECSAKAKVVPIDNMPVTREELKELIRTTPFTQIGNMYGVSDNTIRKWCIKFNLPSKVSEIKNISNDSWELI